MASIARAFTLRHRSKRSESKNTITSDETPALPPLSPKRAASMRYSQKGVDIRKISSPVQLLSTTNMLTYDAPDVAVAQAQRKASMSVSSGSSRDSDASSQRSRGTLSTDISSVDNSPVSSPHVDKGTSYFESTPAVKGAMSLRRSISTLEIRHKSEEEALPERSESPAIPQRHPSHSKRAHADLARKRSLQSISNPIRTSADLFNTTTHDPAAAPTSHPAQFQHRSQASSSNHHPFGKELEQLKEVAEEFTGAVHDAQAAEDLRVMKKRGLVRFCANDYLGEIEPLFGGMFGSSHPRSHLQAPAMAWI